MADRVGQQLGNYRLIRLLGRGGFAEVYLGEHLRLSTQAAIKVLHTSLEAHDVEGFLREAKTVAGLKHPHIVRVFDFDVENHTPFLVMDYLPNGNVRRSYPKGTLLPPQTIVSYVTQVASALQYAHDEKLIHRDVKPENMLLDQANTLVLTDFGIALMTQSSRHQSTQDVAGTAAYMAPEQFQGHPRRASDQYALGVVVYEWLTGDKPFHGSFSEIASQHLFVPPPSLCRKESTITPAVERVVLLALEKDPDKRFRSVKAFATALEQAYQNTQVSPEFPSVPLSSFASATVSGEQNLQAELPIAEIAPAPEQPASQTSLRSPFTVPSPPETPSGSPTPLSSSVLPPFIAAQRPLRSDEPQTGQHIRQEIPENVGTGPLPTLAPTSTPPRSLVIPPRRMFSLMMSSMVAIVLLVVLLLVNGIVPARIATPTATAIPKNTPTPTPIPTVNITQFPLPTANSQPGEITRGLDGNLWFTEWSGNKIGRISPDGTVTEFPLPTAKSQPSGITAGPDGNLWFTEWNGDNGDEIGRITPNGTITEFPLPAFRSQPWRITVGADDNLWFTENNSDKIGRISLSGTITEFPFPTAKSASEGITTGPDGNVWFTDAGDNEIGRITIAL